MRWTFLISGCLQGVWMLTDAIRLMAGPMIGSGKEPLGLWARLVAQIGIDPYRLGPFFLVFGAIWLFVTLAVVTGRRWAVRAAVVIAFASLWYLLPGAALSAIYLITLRTLPRRKENA